MSVPRVGDRVRIERDELKYPPDGTWSRFRGRVGTVVMVNAADGEVGVVFGATRRHPVNGALQGDRVIWFAVHEVRTPGGAGVGRRTAPRTSGVDGSHPGP